MKTLYLILSLLVLVSISNAQLIRGFGLKVGTTISNQDWEYSASSGFQSASFDTDNRTELNIGVFTEILNIPFISIVTEVNYLQKGMEKNIEVTSNTQLDGTGEYFTWGIKVSYINFSALGKFRINTGLLTPYVLLGPKIDFEINQSNSVGSSSLPEENFRKNMFGLKAGIGTEINLLPLSFLVEFVYDADINELYENQNVKVKTNSFDLRIGVIL